MAINVCHIPSNSIEDDLSPSIKSPPDNLPNPMPFHGYPSIIRYLASIVLTIALAGMCLADSTIVHWGEPGGETDVVTASQNFSNPTTTYTIGAIASPAVGADYYPSASGRSPVFNHAATTSNNTKNITNNDTDGDFIASGKNIAFYESMVCWETFLTSDSTLRSLAIETRVSRTDVASQFRWIIHKLGGGWYASGPVDTTSAFAPYSTADPGGLTWYDFTPVTDGSATINPVASSPQPDMIGVDIVGFYTNFTNTAGNPYCALHTRYFKATDSPAPIPLLSYDTGYTIMNVRTGMLAGDSVIVAASYEGTMLAMDYDGNILWTNPLTGYMVRDVWCADLDNDGTDEVLTAVADGSVHCLNLTDGSSHWAQPFKPNDVPMNAVCAVRSGPTTRFVACGGFDMNMYYLSATGTLIETVDSHDYSDLQPWGDSNIYLGRTIGKAHNANFLRPIPQADGTDHLMMLGSNNHMQVSGYLYEFAPLTTTPSVITKITPYSRGVGAMRVVDPDNDGNYSVLLGSSELGNQQCLELDRQTGTFQTHALTDIGDNGYRVTQPEVIPSGNSYKIFMICGTHIVLLPPDFDETQKETISGSYAYNDMWRDPTNNRILLASSQSGGSAIHILDTTQSNWKAAFQNLNPPGKIQTIKNNFNAVRGQIASFTAPSRERTPLQVTETQANPAVALAVELAANYNNPVFLDNPWNTHVEERSWRTSPAPIGIPNTKFQNKEDTRKTYDLTQQQIVDSYTSAYANPDASSGISFWGGHGNDPYYHQPGTLKMVLDLAQARNQNQKTVMIWPEVGRSDSDFEQVLDHLFYPLAEHDQADSFRIFFRSKDIYWQSGIYQPAWSRFIAGEFKDTFVPALEETSDKTMELSLAGRLGLWASGCVDDWGMRCSRDNPSFDRSRQHSYQRLPNHFLRNMVHNLAYGARYMNNTYVDTDHMSLAWELVAKGALFVPKREEIVSFSPVHVSMTAPHERYVKEGTTTKFSTNYDATEEAANPMVFGRMNSTWLAAKNTDWDFSRYAAGVKDRRQSFIPPYPHGMVLITPVQDGIHAAPDTYRNSLIENLHPLYTDIVKEHITNGHSYLESDSMTTHVANSSYYQTVASDIQTKKAQLPVTVSGEVAWVCAQSAPTHLRLTLVDSGYLNPKALTAAVSLHTVEPYAITDVLTGQTLTMTGSGQIDIPVPLGMFRLIDIELTEPFYAPPKTWEEFHTGYHLSGDPAADWDSDGALDVEEFGLNGNPRLSTDAGTAPTVSFDFDAKTASFSNLQITGSNSGITYIPEWSENLSNWSNAWTSTTTDSSPDPNYDQLTRDLDLTDKERVFFRLRITQP